MGRFDDFVPIAGGGRAVHLVDPRFEQLGAGRPERYARQGGGRPVAGLGKRMAHRGHEQPADNARLAEAHLRLRRVHVHIHSIRRAIDEERHGRMTIPAQQVRIGAAESSNE